MIRSLTAFVRHWRELQRFNDLDDELRSIVFYAEDGGSRPHFERMIEHLTGPLGQDICYLTSSDNDPVLQSTNPRIHAFSIGEGTVRTKAFVNLRAGVVVMTMPSLEQYWIKRSRAEEVCYVYVFHSIVSSHMVYVQAAFDHYDTMFCVGPHHNAEVRATEAAYGLTEKRLSTSATVVSTPSSNRRKPRRVTTTSEQSDPRADRAFVGSRRPAGEPCSTTCADSVGGRLPYHGSASSDDGQEIPGNIRQAARRIRRQPPAGAGDRHGGERLAATLSRDDQRLVGAALEYAFSRERPVLFVAVPRKVNNPEYEKISCTPLEVSIRTEIGDLVEPDRLDAIPEILHRMRTHPDKYRSAIREARDRTFTTSATAAEWVPSYRGPGEGTGIEIRPCPNPALIELPFDSCSPILWNASQRHRPRSRARGRDRNGSRGYPAGPPVARAGRRTPPRSA